MDLYNTILKVSDCCYYTNCDKHSFTGWCRSGYIKAKRGPKQTSPWRVQAIDFADFLYFNKYYLNTYREKKLIGEAKKLRDEILSEVDARPPVMDATELANLFNISSQTVRNWVKRGVLSSCGNASNRLYVIQLEEVREAFERQPWMQIRYRTIYTAINRRKANRKLLTAASL